MHQGTGIFPQIAYYSSTNSWVAIKRLLIPINPIGSTKIAPTAGSLKCLEIASATKKQAQAIPKPPKPKVKLVEIFFIVFMVILL